MSQQTLYCNNGEHEWQRELKRGRVPTNCPEHKATATTLDEAEARTKRLQEGRQRQAQARRKIVIEEILGKPANARCRCGITPAISDDTLRKLTGCTDPIYVCSTLDAVRRAVLTYND